MERDAMSAVARLTVEDTSSLSHLVDAYADAVDRRDAMALVGLFTPDGRVRVQPEDGPVESSYEGAAVADLLASVAGYDRTFHHVGGRVFALEPDGDGVRATGRVHCLAHHYQRTSNGPVDLVMMIRYLDGYDRAVDGGWLIADRQVVVDWTELHPAHPPRRSRPRSSP
jgi:ketosteroid isomerase-like protein